MRRSRHNPLARLRVNNVAVIVPQPQDHLQEEWFILMLGYRNALSYTEALFERCPPPSPSSSNWNEAMEALGLGPRTFSNWDEAMGPISAGYVPFILGFTRGTFFGPKHAYMEVRRSAAMYGYGPYLAEMKYYMARKWNAKGVTSDRTSVSVYALREYQRLYQEAEEAEDVARIALPRGTHRWPKDKEELNWAYMPKNFNALISAKDKRGLLERGDEIREGLGMKFDAHSRESTSPNEYAEEILEDAGEIYFQVVYGRLSPTERGRRRR